MSRSDEADRREESASELLTLGRDEAHLWYAWPDAITDRALLNRYEELLCSDEQARQRRYRRDEPRHQFLLARALVRSTLSRYCAVAPQDWRFESNAYGRPEISEPANDSRLRFNLSHTKGLMVCAVAYDDDLGVDVENVARRTPGVDLARRYFSAAEVADLLALPAHEQQRAFFDYWTLKEAYIKARGKGLAIPLGQFSFHLRSGAAVRISCERELEDDPNQWQFAQVSPTSEHRTGLAVRRPASRPMQIVVREVVPLIHERELPRD